MLSREKIKLLFEQLNQLLSKKNIKGEIGLVGGAVMCLVYNSRAATQDVDAIFEPTSMLRELAKEIAEKENISPEWLNDGAKGFIREGFARVPLMELSHLSIWTPEPKYMLAMKCMSARWDSSDRDDVQTLVKFLRLTKKDEVFRIIEGFYPKNQIPSKTQFFIEELMDES